MTSSGLRGQCSKCRRWFALTLTGKLRRHGYPPLPCPGSGKNPQET